MMEKKYHTTGFTGKYWSIMTNYYILLENLIYSQGNGLT
jgi:hypothetical protein